MSTIINITPSSLFTFGTVCTSSGDGNNTLNDVGSTALALSTSMATGLLTFNANAEATELTKTYVESLSEEEVQKLYSLLDEKEIELENNNGIKLVLK